MRQGETASYQGSQVALLPFDYVDITQNSGPNSFSHCCGHAADFRFPYTRYPVYAPFDCHEISAYDSYAGRTFCSDAPVWTPGHGLTYVTFRIVHDDLPMAGSSFRQGQICGHSGNSGASYGDHCHIDCSPQRNAQLVSFGVTCRQGNACVALQGSSLQDSIFYATGSEVIQNSSADGITQTFTVWAGFVGRKIKAWLLLAAGMLLHKKDEGAKNDCRNDLYTG